MADKSKWVVCCEIPIISAEGATLSLINMLEEVTPAGYPVLVPRFAIVSLV